MTEHIISLVPARDAGKLDASPDSRVAVCSCGKYQSSPCAPGHAERRGFEHAEAKRAGRP